MFSFLHHLQNQAWMTWELTESLTNKTFWVFAILTFGTKLMKWLSIKDTSPKDFLRVQIRYFIVFFAFQIPLTLQMPYGYFRYVDDGLGPKTIANVKIIYNMTAAFSGLFAGSFLSFFKHKFTIIFGTALSIVVSHLRYLGGIYNFVIAAIVVGFVSANVKIAFDDWILNDISKFESCPYLHFIFNENFAMLNLINSIVFLNVGDSLYQKGGSKGVFLYSELIQIILFFVVVLGFKYNISNSKSENKNEKLAKDEKLTKDKKLTKDEKIAKDDNNSRKVESNRMAFSEIFKSKDRRMISMVLLDQVYGIIMSLFWPCVPSFFIGLKISMARITGMNQLVLPIGAMIVSAFCHRFSSNIILSFFFLFGSFVVALISYYYNNKFLVYLLIISYAACEGAYSSLIMGLRKEIYPSSLRGHIMGINRLLQSIYASILIQYTQSLPPDIQPLVTSFVLFVCFILVIFIHHFQQKSDADKQLAGKNEEIKKEENNISKQVTKKKLE